MSEALGESQNGQLSVVESEFALGWLSTLSSWGGGRPFVLAFTYLCS